MDLARITLATAEISSAYQLFLAALQGRYLALRAGMAPGAAQVAQLRSDGLAFVQTFLGVATRVVHDYAARSPDGVDPALADAIAERVDALYAFHRGASLRNVEQAVLWLSAPSLKLASAFTTPPTGAMGVLYQKQLAQPGFTLPDAASRDWNAYVMVKTSTRDAFYQAEIDAEVAKIIAAGAKLARVVHPDGGDPKNGVIVRVSGEGDFASLATVRTKLFHVNAQATLEPYHRV